MRLEVATAIIAAGASIAGGIVGGGAAYVANERQQSREDRRDRAEARAVAMIELQRFQTVSAELQSMAAAHLYVSNPPARPGVPLQELKPVLARLTRGESRELSRARLCVTQLDALVRGHEPGEVVPGVVRPQVTPLLHCVQLGVGALDELVGTAPLD